MRIYLLLVFLLLFGITPNSAGSPFHITSINITPDVVVQNTQVTVSVEFDDTTGISSVSSFYCQLEPQYFCHIPVMALIAEGKVYSTIFTVTENNGSVIGFDIIIKYDNSTRLTLPKDAPDAFDMEIAEPLTNIFYFRVYVGLIADTSISGSDNNYSQSGNSTPNISQSNSIDFILPISILLIPLIRKIKR